MQASFVGAMAIADLVKTTLGPKGMVREALGCVVPGCSTARPLDCSTAGTFDSTLSPQLRAGSAKLGGGATGARFATCRTKFCRA